MVLMLSLSRRSKIQINQGFKILTKKYDLRYNEINTDTEYKLKEEKSYKYFDERD